METQLTNFTTGTANAISDASITVSSAGYCSPYYHTYSIADKETKLILSRSSNLSHKEYLEKNAQLMDYLESSGWVIKKVKILN